MEQNKQYFHDVILGECNLWVATIQQQQERHGQHGQHGQIVGYLAMNGSYIDRLYVDPDHWRQGWGQRLVMFAKQLSPQGLELHTHVENSGARALYEGNNFSVVKFGISPPPESAPDIEYHWRSDVAGFSQQG